jgi:GNAT superfamily N-acetyltransferase
VTKSLYLHDPDGNTVEIYVNGTDAWRSDPALILSESCQLDLSDTTNEATTGAVNVAVTRVESGESARLAPLVGAFRDHLRVSAPTDRELLLLMPRLLADPSLEFAVATLDGAPVGYTQMRLHASLWRPPAEALLEDLFVLPAARGRAVGRALLRHAVGRARTRGARLLALTTNERNQGAQALYRSEGLEPDRTEIWNGGREIRWVIDLNSAARD